MAKAPAQGITVEEGVAILGEQVGNLAEPIQNSNWIRVECKWNVRKKKVVNTLKSAMHGSRDTKCKKNVSESTSRPMSKFMQCSSRPNLSAAHVREDDSKLA